MTFEEGHALLLERFDKAVAMLRTKVATPGFANTDWREYKAALDEVSSSISSIVTFNTAQADIERCLKP